MRILGLPPDVGTVGKPIKLGQREPIGPCGQYRIKYPLEALERAGLAEIDYGGYPLDYAWEYAREFDIILMHRQAYPQHMAFLDHCRLLLNKKFVIDLDDDLLDLDPRSPAYVWFGKDKDLVWEKFCELREQGQVDNRLGDVKPEQIWAVVENMRKNGMWMFANADLVTVTTGFLKKKYGRYAKKVEILPNCIVQDDWAGVEPKRLPETEGKIILGWAGSNTHEPDLRLVKTAIARVLKKFENVCFVIVGYPAAKALFPESVQDKIHTVPWSDLKSYKGWLAGFDIGLAPAQNIATNRAKSGIRIYELALAKKDGMAVVASPIPYQADVHGAMGFIAANDAKFYKAIKKYILMEDLRKEHGANLRAHVLETHTMGSNVNQWFNAYKELLDGLG